MWANSKQLSDTIAILTEAPISGNSLCGMEPPMPAFGYAAVNN
jgi:hypothetical protein